MTTEYIPHGYAGLDAAKMCHGIYVKNIQYKVHERAVNYHFYNDNRLICGVRLYIIWVMDCIQNSKYSTQCERRKRMMKQ